MKHDTRAIDENTAALQGVRVLDMSRVMAGPWAAQLLSDFGAEVIKLEHPVRGDDSRSWEPSFRSEEQPDQRQSAYFCSANRGKKSVTLDFARPEGAELIRRLAAESDVLIENYKVGTLARYGLGYEDLVKINPRLIYCSVTGFGQTGPYRARPGYDTIIQAMGGMMDLTGHPDGFPGDGPMRVGLPVIDLMTGVYSALAVSLALNHRQRSGKGQHIDLGLLDVNVASLSYFGMNYLASGVLPVRTGNANPVTYPSGIFEAKDKSMSFIVGNNEQFRRLSIALGLPHLAEDARYRTSPDRVKNSESLRAEMQPSLLEHDAEYWMKTLEGAGIPCAPINNLHGVFTNEQVKARESIEILKHPVLGPIPTLVNPIKMSASPAQYKRPPPLLGEDTHNVLTEILGLSEADLAQLRLARAI